MALIHQEMALIHLQEPSHGSNAHTWMDRIDEQLYRMEFSGRMA